MTVLPWVKRLSMKIFSFASQFLIHRTGAFGVHAKATSAELIKHFCRLDGLRNWYRFVGHWNQRIESNLAKGHGISFTGPATLHNSSIRGSFWRVSRNGHMTWHASTTSTISDAQKRCDMRIIGFDKESRPVLYFCVKSSVEMDFFPKTHAMRTAFYWNLKRLWARKIGCRLGLRTIK